MNPSAPHIYGTIKLHKQENPIRPIVNWRDSPHYTIAKTPKYSIKLPPTLNVQYTNMLTQSLNQIKINEHIQLCSFDNKNICI
jgi:hypothetical protein